MVKSMTAFARTQITGDWGTATWEVKSVNQRFLEPNFRMPEMFRNLEVMLREKTRKHLTRGKVDCSLRYEASQTGGGDLQLDRELASQLIAAHEALQDLSGEKQTLDLASLLRWPGLLKAPEADTESLEKQLVEGFEEALAQLNRARDREGAALADMLRERLTGIEAQVAIVETQLPEIATWQRERILNRFADAQVEPDKDRLEQELVMLAQKTDVMEELDRLKTHIAEVRRLLDKGGATGRRLDFLMQEFNREANTLGSKSINSTVTACAVEIKVLIEQMREQVQNIE